jgi:cytoskeletal protein CcmA (bactofilin family)
MFSNKERLESFVGRSSHFRGDIATKGAVRIDGRVTGNIDADWVIIGDKAFLKGDVSASGVVIGGSVEGNVRAKELVEIKSKGTVKGNIKTAKLTVIDGGAIDGQISMSRDEAKVVELSKDRVREA